MSVLWEPSQERINQSEMTRFTKSLSQEFSSYTDLHEYSVKDPGAFWSSVADFFDVRWQGEREPACDDLSFTRYGWFPHMKLNFAENLLAKGSSNRCALHFVHESGARHKTTYQELRKQTACFQGALQRLGFEQGDVLAAFMPNMSETVVSMLGATSLGGVFTSTSADFGVEGVMDRFGQSKPRVLVTVSHYTYNGKKYSLLPKLSEIARELKSVEKIVVVDFLNSATKEEKEEWQAIEKVTWWQDFMTQGESHTLHFTEVPFAAPLYIMYSSGTTGKPKCIVHGVGGTLLQHIKELGLHTNLTQDKTIFYFTTCGWMMWNWLVSSLYFGAEIVLYEGSPGYPSLGEFFEIIDREQIHLFGTSPKFLKALQDSGYTNNKTLASLETILSTGAPLLPEQFDYIYQSLKKDVCVSSISGGTDIIGCFMLGNPNLPVRPGEIQCLGLGMDVAAVDDEGNAHINKEGELVCRQSFPSRPLYFLNDESSERINDAYFNRFPGFWHHGDFISVSEHGGVRVMGRSDATLNPGGVRIGTAEIYRQTEQFTWLADSACVGRQVDGDVEVVLFVKMAENEELTEERVTEIKKTIKDHTTPRHVPKHIWPVNDIPYTRSGKKMELAITRLIAGRALTNIEAVANPECLDQFKGYVI